MPVLKTILMLLILGSSMPFLLAAKVSAGNRTGAESQVSAVSVTVPDSAIKQELSSAQQDPKLLAEKAIADGKQFEEQGTADSLRKALENYERALALWRTLKDGKGEGETLDHIGAVHYFLEENEKALADFQQELQLWRASGDHLNEAEALNNIGVVYSAMGLEHKSIEAYEQALPLRRAVGDRLGLATTLGNIGISYLTTGELQKALDYFNQALPIYKELNSRPGIANTLNNIGGVHMTWGDLRKSLEYFEQALAMRHELGQRRDEAVALNNIGRAYDMLGESQKALDYHRQALEIRRALGQRTLEAASINNIGMVYDSLGEKQKALEHYKLALDLFRTSNDRNGEAATLNNIGAFHINTLNDPQTSLEYHLQALKIRRELGQRIAEAVELDNIGFAYNKLGNLQKALEYHGQALDINRSSGHRRGEASSLANLGAISYFKGDYQTAFDYYMQALQLERAMGIRTTEAVTLYGLAMIERDRGNLAEARSRMNESLNIIESLRGNVANQDLRASYLAQKQDYYEFYTDLLVRSHQREPAKGFDVAALQASERARARSLLELLAEARIDVDQGIAPELKQHERAINGRIAWIQSHLIEAYSQAKPDRSKITMLEEELKKADEDREQLNMEIRQKHPRYADLQYPTAPGLKAIQSLLDDSTVLLEYALGKDNSFLFAVTNKDLLVARIASDSSITEQVKALRLMITSRPQRSALGKEISLSRQLYQELVEPAQKLLTGKQKLIIVPSGILHYLPFEVLLSAGAERTLTSTGPGRWPYLVRDYSISYVPSAAVLASLRSRPEERTRPSKKFIAFGDPFYGNTAATETSLLRSRLRGAFGDERSWKLGRLLESRREVEQIAGLYRKDQATVLLGQEASEENAKTVGRLGQYRFIHFATHGLLNEERPQYSGLILSLKTTSEVPPKPTQTGSPSVDAAAQSATSNQQLEDGLLQVYEVFNLKLNADLVVLSACETGLGKEVKGEGLIGLTHAFLFAGTPSVLVSLWSVQDRSTADLMVNVYQQLDRSQDKAEALRQAKLKLIQNNRYAHPYYWAPFILTGEPK